MQKITKKTIKRIQAGNYDDLMNSIEFLIDSYNEDKFDAGYKSCLDDMAVRAYNLVQFLINEKNWVFDGDTGEDMIRYIEEYFTNALKQE